MLNEQDTVEPVVYAGYYGVAGDYHKVKAEYGPYYKHALLYLACVDVDKELSDEDRKARAHDLCIAALLGENIYNFGELVRDNVNTDLEKGRTNDWISCNTQSCKRSLGRNTSGSRISSARSTMARLANSRA